MSYITGLGGTPGPGYFTDNNGHPVLQLKDDVWALVANGGANGPTYQTDMTTLLSTRASQGFTSILVAAIGDTHIQSPASGDTWDGVAPFSTAYTVLNPTYWTRVDYLINTAATYGITIVLNVVFTYSLSNPSNIMYGINSGSNPSDYGTALGNRYKSGFPNLMWQFGDDYDGSSFPAVFSGVASGIQGSGDTHPLYSIENNASGSTARYALSDSTYSSEFSWGGTYATWDWLYYYAETYFAVEFAYKEPSPLLPIAWTDGMYWGEVAGGTSGNDNTMRLYAWWALSSGARGFGTGDSVVQFWPANAPLTDGSWYTSWAGNIRTYIQSLPGWYQLIPDTSSALVTAGRGTRASYNGSAGQGYISSNTYVTASRTSTGSLAIIYLPAHTTITINQAKMQAGYTAKWVDPASCAVTSTATGSSYTSSGTNSAGGADWVLVLQGPSAPAAGPAFSASMGMS